MTCGKIKEKQNGRPTKYDGPYHSEEVIKYMSKGYSKEACAGLFGISKQTFYNWASKHPEFLDAIKRGETASLLYWERTGLEGVQSGNKFNATVWIFNMKNRFGWRDKKELGIESKIDADISLDQNEKAQVDFALKVGKMSDEELRQFIRSRQNNALG